VRKAEIAEDEGGSAAMRHSKLPDAEPDPSIVTFIATWEIDAVPPPER
jgi:hypothetical protein